MGFAYVGGEKWTQMGFALYDMERCGSRVGSLFVCVG